MRSPCTVSLLIKLAVHEILWPVFLILKPTYIYSISEKAVFSQITIFSAFLQRIRFKKMKLVSFGLRPIRRTYYLKANFIYLRQRDEQWRSTHHVIRLQYTNMEPTRSDNMKNLCKVDTGRFDWWKISKTCVRRIRVDSIGGKRI